MATFFIPVTADKDYCVTSDHLLALPAVHKLFSVGGVARGKAGRKVTNGPEVAGPWAWASGCASVIAANPEHGTWGTIRRAQAEGRYHEVADGDTIIFDDVEYRLRIVRREWIELDAIRDLRTIEEVTQRHVTLTGLRSFLARLDRLPVEETRRAFELALFNPTDATVVAYTVWEEAGIGGAFERFLEEAELLGVSNAGLVRARLHAFEAEQAEAAQEQEQAAPAPEFEIVCPAGKQHFVQRLIGNGSRDIVAAFKSRRLAEKFVAQQQQQKGGR